MTHAAQAPAGPTEPQIGRRKFFQWLTGAVGAVATVILSAPIVGYIFGVLKKPEDLWVPLGPLKDFPLDTTRMITFDTPLRQPWDGIAARGGVFVRYEGKNEKNEDNFLILDVNCAHLGCPVSWFPQSGLYMCPCHGGVYYGNGERASGPPPRGLFKCVWRIKSGILEVQAPHYPTLQNPLRDDDKGHG